MKNFFKAASILAAVSMMFAFASCQQQDPETPTKSDPAPVFKAETTEPVDLAPLGVTSITEAKVADEKIATVKAEGTKVTVTSVAKGTTAATVKVAGKKDGKDATGEVTFSITVAETGKITTTTPSGELTPTEDPVVPPATKYTCDGCGTEYDTEEEKNNCAKQAGCPKYVAEAYSFTADFTKLNTTITGITVAAESGGKAKLTATEEVAFDEVAVLYSRSEGKLIRRVAGDTYSINYGNSSLAKAGASGDGQFTAEEAEVGKTIVFTQKINDAQNRDGYVGVDLSKKSSIAATADVKVTFDFYTVANSACSADCGVVAVVDADGKVLASKTGLKLKTGAGSSEKETIEVTIKGGTKAYLLFSRNGCTKGGKSSGGIDLTGIKVEELTNN